jgi:hypothetical protein
MPSSGSRFRIRDFVACATEQIREQIATTRDVLGETNGAAGEPPLIGQERRVPMLLQLYYNQRYRSLMPVASTHTWLDTHNAGVLGWRLDRIVDSIV